MAFVYRYIGSHGCWSNDGTRYIVKGEYTDKLTDFPTSMAHRFAVVETAKGEPQPTTAPTSKEQHSNESECEVEVSED
jgi:hypothetical protein